MEISLCCVRKQFVCGNGMAQCLGRQCCEQCSVGWLLKKVLQGHCQWINRPDLSLYYINSTPGWVHSSQWIYPRVKLGKNSASSLLLSAWSASTEPHQFFQFYPLQGPAVTRWELEASQHCLEELRYNPGTGRNFWTPGLPANPLKMMKIHESYSVVLEK